MTPSDSIPFRPRVSVVMPAYNTERYVTAAVHSALESGEPAVEVLVIDDGSTDTTAAELRKIYDSRLKVISIQASGAPARPRNIGIGHARAPYLAFLDSDDVLKPGRLAASVAILERYPSAGIAFSDFETIDAESNVIEVSVSPTYPILRTLKTQPAAEDWRLIQQSEFARGLLHENFIGTSGVVIRTDLLKVLGGFDESLPNGEDLDLWFRFAHHCDALYSPTVAHSYRIRPRSVEHGPTIRNATTRIEVLRREKARWAEREARRQIDRRIAENLATVGYQRRRQHQPWAAVRAFFHAFTTSPNPRWARGLFGSVIWWRR
jgi:glycosyltransferase involved in cell wall biosynthesis